MLTPEQLDWLRRYGASYVDDGERAAHWMQATDDGPRRINDVGALLEHAFPMSYLAANDPSLSPQSVYGSRGRPLQGEDQLVMRNGRRYVRALGFDGNPDLVPPSAPDYDIFSKYRGQSIFDPVEGLLIPEEMHLELAPRQAARNAGGGFIDRFMDSGGLVSLLASMGTGYGLGPGFAGFESMGTAIPGVAEGTSLFGYMTGQAPAPVTDAKPVMNNVGTAAGAGAGGSVADTITLGMESMPTPFLDAPPEIGSLGVGPDVADDFVNFVGAPGDVGTGFIDQATGELSSVVSPAGGMTFIAPPSTRLSPEDLARANAEDAARDMEGSSQGPGADPSQLPAAAGTAGAGGAAASGASKLLSDIGKQVATGLIVSGVGAALSGDGGGTLPASASIDPLDEEARRQDQRRLARKGVDDAFLGFDDDYYAGIAGAYRDYQNPLLDEQFGEAARLLPLRMPTTASSAFARRRGNLQRDYERARVDIGRQAEDHANQRRMEVENNRSALHTAAELGAGLEGAENQAATVARALVSPPAFSPIGDMFAKYTGNMLNARLAADRGHQPVRPLLFGDSAGRRSQSITYG